MCEVRFFFLAAIFIFCRTFRRLLWQVLDFNVWKTNGLYVKSLHAVLVNQLFTLKKHLPFYILFALIVVIEKNQAPSLKLKGSKQLRLVPILNKTTYTTVFQMNDSNDTHKLLISFKNPVIFLQRDCCSNCDKTFTLMKSRWTTNSLRQCYFCFKTSKHFMNRLLLI